MKQSQSERSARVHGLPIAGFDSLPTFLTENEDKSMKRYLANYFSSPTIQEVEIEEETEHSFWIHGSKIFDSFAEAKSFLIETYGDYGEKMKVYHNDNNKFIDILAVKPGEVFSYNEGIFMMMDYGTGDSTTAVNLSSGTPTEFADTARVKTLPDAYLTID